MKLQTINEMIGSSSNFNNCKYVLWGKRKTKRKKVINIHKDTYPAKIIGNTNHQKGKPFPTSKQKLIDLSIVICSTVFVSNDRTPFLPYRIFIIITSKSLMVSLGATLRFLRYNMDVMGSKGTISPLAGIRFRTSDPL